jgi:Tfp pilus assembly protein PilO
MIKRGPVVAGLISVVAIILLVVALILPKANQVRQRQAMVGDAKQKQGTLELELQQLKAAAKEAKPARHELEVLTRQVPPTVRLPDLILMLNDAADDSDVDFMSMTPGSPVEAAAGNLSILTTQLMVTGDYFAVDEFLHRLERLPRAAKVRQIDMTKQATATGSTTRTSDKIQVTLQAEFYTTDVSSGPGSLPGHTDASQLPQAAAPTPTPSTGG